MEVFIGAIFVLLMIYIGFTYAQMLIENKVLREELGETDQKNIKNIFICKKDSEYIKKLVTANIDANIKAGAQVKSKDFRVGMERIEFNNKTEIIIFYGDNIKVDKFKKHELASCTIRVFFDYKMPDSAIRAYLDGLGLRNYIVGFGICDEN